MQLESKRLRLFPLTLPQLILYLQGQNQLEQRLSLKEGNRNIPTELVEAFHQTILPAVADPSKDYLFSTLWTAVDKDLNIMVADLCFKGGPNAEGEIEIGYGTYDAFQGQGYMTEAIGAMIPWAFSQPGVKAIIAETEAENIASHKTLIKNNFTRYKGSEDMLWWRLDKE
jgi:RimJ/RimL family protein N-acetyltransferase